MTSTREASPVDQDETITTDELRTLGERVRTNAGIENGMHSFSECQEVSQNLKDKLDELNIVAWVLEAHMGMARETHYCLYLPPDAVEDVYERDRGIVVDPTMDQFCTENAQRGKTKVDFGTCKMLPAVAIHKPGDEERITSYFRPKTPLGVYNHYPYGRQ